MLLNDVAMVHCQQIKTIKIKKNKKNQTLKKTKTVRNFPQKEK